MRGSAPLVRRVPGRGRDIVQTVAIATLVGLVGCGGGSAPQGPGDGDNRVATYRVEFDATWSAATHPMSFPPNPHFSGLIGATHSNGFVLWTPGELATQGIENMAETGSKGALTAEIEAAIQAGTARAVLSGGGVSPSPGVVSLTFQIEEDAPLVSLVSMIAPSPDWFVGVRDLSLRENGEWVQSIAVDLLPYDSGTDSGPSFTSSNADTNPAVTIRRLDQAPLAGGVPLGTFTFVRQ